MRLARCLYDGKAYCAVVEDDRVCILDSDYSFAQMLAMAPTDIRAHTMAERAIDNVQLLPPVDRPDKIICVGLNYRDHASEAASEPAPYPSLFVRFPSSQVGHRAPIVAPFNSTQFDYEGELAVVIGRPAHHVSPEQAMEHVGGYCCFAENSVRDFQQHSRQITPGKNFLASGAVGPWITTSDEVGDLRALSLITRLNGVEVQRTSLSDMIYDIPALIAYISSFTQLLPGDIIATGTPAGVGALRKPAVWMKAGDILEIEISNVGRLVNPVIGEMERSNILRDGPA